MNLRLAARKLYLNLLLDGAVLRAPELRGERLRFLAEKYVAILSDRREVRFLGAPFAYDNRLMPSMLPAYLAEVRRLRRLCGPAQTVLDIGANVGQFGAVAARLFPDARIVSFEPNPAAFACLERNVRTVERWEAVPFGLASHAHTAELFSFRANQPRGASWKRTQPLGSSATPLSRRPRSGCGRWTMSGGAS